MCLDHSGKILQQNKKRFNRQDAENAKRKENDLLGVLASWRFIPQQDVSYLLPDGTILLCAQNCKCYDVANSKRGGTHATHSKDFGDTFVVGGPGSSGRLDLRLHGAAKERISAANYS
jgi:hypothetical protein